LYYKLDVITTFELQMMSVLIDRKYILDMSQDRKMYKCTCADCGKDSEVPFEPKPDRPVYCKECLPKHQK
jgi:CxxC-x17-CxxC domain-containing protein